MFQLIRENKRDLFILTGLAFAFVFIYKAWITKAPVTDSLETSDVLQLEQITLKDYQLDQQRWELKGRKAWFYEKEDKLRLEDITVWHYGNSELNPEQTIKDAQINADQAMIDLKTEQMELLDNISMVHQSGTEVYTEKAFYDLKKGLLKSPPP